jgi:hypothetical protein
MGEILFFNEARNKNQFRIDYPYYGLFGSANITTINNESEVIYKCQLLNGTIIFLKKLAQARKWIDANLNIETPLSTVIGMSIDDFLKTATAK